VFSEIFATFADRYKKLLIMKKVVILILVIAAIVALLMMGNNHRQEQRLYSKMQGYLNVDWQNSALERSSDYSFPLVLQPINIEGDSISLPLIMIKNDTITNDTTNNQTISERELECVGSWQIISCQPDSIQILVPGHPFSGKYEVAFKKEYISNQYHFLIYLKNDSTNLICEKNESFISGRPKILENWED